MIDLELLEEYGATSKKLSADEIIFHEGTDCYFYHQVISGHVRWVNFTDDGGEFIQDIMGAGESFGEYPLFDGLPYAASAIANEDAEIVRLRKDKFLKLLEANPQIQMDFLKMYNAQGHSIIYTSHLLEEAQELCDEVAIIDNGKLVVHGNTEELIISHHANNLEDLFLKITGTKVRD